MQNFDSNKGADIFGISAKFLKLAGLSLTEILTLIFNKCIQEGIFPDSLKIANIIPVHKDDSLFETSNYRPISLLPIISKHSGRIVFNRLNDFLSKHNILTPNQFGFQKNNSTEFVINTIQNNIINSFENKETAYCIFLDFAKAFDTILHQ